MATNDLQNTNLEFIASNGTAYTAVGTYAAIAAFSTSTAVVTVTINAISAVPQTINAGAYAHLIDISAVGTYAPIFDIGFSSTYSAASSKYNNGTSTSLTTGGYNNAVEGYGTLELSNAIALNALSISMLGINNTLILDTTSLASHPAGLTGFSSAGDQLVFNGVAASSAKIVSFVYAAGGSTLSFSNGGVTTSILLYGLASTTAAGNFAVSSAAVVEGGNTSTYAGNLVLSYVPCFLRGTMIDTPFGERAVEDLRQGDLVTALVDGRQVPRPVRWVGGSRMDAARHAHRDSAFPVRVRRDAFGDNMPHRDLLVTPEHCLLTEAGLVPARMLVNGDSIVIDRDLGCYDYFHVELDTHSILISDGLPTESYLDGENRALLDRAGATAPAAGLAAPLAVSRAVVEPIWSALKARAAAIGLSSAVQARAAVMTDDPGLRLLLDDGSEIAACRRDAQHHMFQIPRGTRPTRLRSRASVPSEVIGPFVDDRRLLGVAVDRMVMWTGLDERVVPVGDGVLRGWHDENSAARWTNGDAELDLPAAAEERFLDVHVAATLPYHAA